MERTAFARAKAFLDFSPRAKWLAIVAGVVTGLFHVFLVILLALAVDLLVSRGRIPNLAQLSVPEQERFVDAWKGLSPELRIQAIQHLGYQQYSQSTSAPLSSKAEDKLQYETWSALIGTESFPPLPGKMDTAELKTWAKKRGIAEEPYLQAMKEQELRWRAYVWLLIRDRVSPEAADSFQPEVKGGDPLPIPGLGEDNHSPNGILSVVVRLRETYAGKLVGFVASVDNWMWDRTNGKDANRIYLTGLLIAAIAGAFLRTGFIMLTNYQAAVATVEAVTRLRRALYHQSSRLGDLSVKSNGSVDSHGLFTRHIESVHEALYLWLTTAFRQPAQFVLLMALALIVQPWLALAVVLFALLVWLMGGQLIAAFRRQGRVSARQAAGRLVLLLESIKLMRLVKSYLMDLFNQSRVERQLSEYSKAHLTRYRGEAFAKPILVLLATLAGITLVYLAGRIVLSEGLSLAGLTILVVAVAGLYVPVKSRLDLNKHLRRGRASAVKVFEFLDQKGTHGQYADAEFLQPMSKALEIRGVNLKEPGATRPILTDVNLVVKSGEKIGIMGADDNEKHALLYLIPRFFDPSDGEVKIDGRNLRWVTLDSLRSQIGLVTPANMIFNDTVANNIGCGDPGVTMPQIFEAAKLAHAHQFITKLPYGYETLIGEMGHSLRTGEQFRVALARAIVRDPAIYIIEEPIVPLDDDTKTLLDDTFNRILQGKTVIFLPHRISTMRMCDQIVLMHNGTIDAIGEHRELVHSSSLYKHLYYLEFNAFAETT